MANRRVLVKRRNAARNIRKITRTMQLIATARFQAAFGRAVASRPYTDKLAEMVGDLARASESLSHPLAAEREAVTKSDLVVVTSNRGLCGGYNSNVLRAAGEHLDQAAAEGVETSVSMIGKKGIAFFSFTERPMHERYDEFGDNPSFDEVQPLADKLMQRFISGEVDAVYVTYMKFLSAGRQTAVVERLLPLATEAPAAGDEAVGAQVEYEFIPEPQVLLDELLPATVRVRLYQAFTDAVVSEQVARMVAMKAATDAAGDMIKRLTQQYNRARQTQITMELLDIVGGANALN